MVIKNRIIELRKPIKVTQLELADALGVTRQTILSLETGKYIASLLLAYKIAKYFGKTIEEVFIFELLLLGVAILFSLFEAAKPLLCITGVSVFSYAVSFWVLRKKI